MTRTQVIVGATVVGLIVLTVVLFFDSLNATHDAQIVGFQRTGDERKIVLVLQVSLLDDIADREVHEDGRTVTVRVHVRSGGGSVPAIGVYLPVTVTLHDRLGSRAVVDGSGATLRDLGPYVPPGAPSPPP